MRREAEEIFRYYERLETNPRAFFVDDVTSRFLLPVLFAVFPADVWDETGEGDDPALLRMAGKTAEAAGYRGSFPSLFPSVWMRKSWNRSRIPRSLTSYGG